MFDGFYLYEWLLMALGIIFFFVLLYAFSVLLKQKKSLGPLLLFFALDIGMIAYPSLKSVEISGDKVTLEKKEQEVAQHFERAYRLYRLAWDHDHDPWTGMPRPWRCC